MNRIAVLLLPICVALGACSQQPDEEERACGGILLSAPEEDSPGAGSFTISELMAHSAAMGMTQEEAETLLYLEGISPSQRLAPGETLCLDGHPG